MGRQLTRFAAFSAHNQVQLPSETEIAASVFDGRLATSRLATGCRPDVDSLHHTMASAWENTESRSALARAGCSPVVTPRRVTPTSGSASARPRA